MFPDTATEPNSTISLRGMRQRIHSAGTRLQPVQVSRWADQVYLLDYATTTAPQLSQIGGSGQCLRCLEGEVYVVAVDLRPASRTYGCWQSLTMSANRRRTLTLPAGVALGWQVTDEYALIAHGRNPDSPAHVDLADWELDIPWPCDLPAEMKLNGEPLAWQEAAPVTVQEPCPPRQAEGMDAVVVPRTPTELRPHISAVETRKAKGLNVDTGGAQPRILVLGSNGQLGRELMRYMRNLGQTIGACRSPQTSGDLPVPIRVDVSRPASIRQAIRLVRPQLIVNASGLTDVQVAEKSPRIAQAVNATAPTVMAEEAQRLGAAMIHFCSDKVFDGQGDRPFREQDTPNPINQYGLTKLRGSLAVANSDVPHLILRTGWLYSTHGVNYVQNLIDLMTYRSSVTLANDYFGSPTSTDWLARTLVKLLSGDGCLPDRVQDIGGLYNMSMLGYASRLDVGDFVVSACRQYALPVVLQRIKGASINELSEVNCPKNCRLDSSRIATTFQLELPCWRQEMNVQIGNILGIGDQQLVGIA